MVVYTFIYNITDDNPKDAFLYLNSLQKIYE